MFEPTDGDTRAMPNDESLRIGFDLAHDLVQIQLGQSDALDSKANFVLGSATVLIGTYAAFLAAHVTTQKYSVPDYLLLNGPLLLSYLATVVFAYLGYVVRKFKTAPNPNKFVELLLHVEVRQTRLTLLEALATAYAINANQLSKKANYVTVALTFLCIEAIILVATLVFIALL
ncbi:MAG TPA: hypothetical protein VIC85_08710 [Ktedonobacterales bacterium]|jgi:hypothetical protein